MKAMLRYRIPALFCIAIMLLATAAFAQSLNPTQELPFIDISLPDYIADNKIDIIGKTDAGATVELYVNNDLVRKKLLSDGNINFIEIELNANQKNIILVRALKGGAVGQKEFSVTSDLISPTIKLKDIPAATKEKTIGLQGELSEICNTSIDVGGINVYSAETQSFSIAASLVEGGNNITITAVDKAGHAASLIKTIISDSIPPKVTDITPKSGSFYYQGSASADISGKTEPFAEVRLYYEYPAVAEEKTERAVIATATADASGYFEFKDINLEHPKPGITLRQLETGEIRTVQELQKSQAVNLFIEATDMTGWKAEEKVSYSVGTCWAGELDFDINPLLEYQYPTLLSPERLNEGTETISFVLSVNYTGNAEKWQVKDILIESACGRSAGVLAEEYKGDSRYEISCNLLGRIGKPAVLDHNRAKNLWYIQYKNLKSTEFANYSVDFWKTLKDRQLIFPLKITVRYTEKEIVYAEQADGSTKAVEQMVPKVQVKCASMGYFVDVPVDVKKVLPDWLLKGGQDFANKTISEIDKVMPKLDQAVAVAGTSCIGSWLTRLGVKIIRKITCRMESIAGQTAKKEGKTTDYCPAEKSTKDETGALALSNEDLKKRCPSCAAMWELESILYQAYRWSCDRVFCHTTPSAWTETANPLQIKTAEAKSKVCGMEDISMMKPLEHIKNCNVEYKSKLKDEFAGATDCYNYNGYLYVSVKPGVGDVYELDFAQRTVPGIIGAKKPPAILKVKKAEGSDTFATAAAFDSCAELCKRLNKNYNGTCEDTKTCTAKTSTTSFIAGYVAGEENGKGACWIEQSPRQCCCFTKEEEKKEEKNKGLPSEWNYREQELYREYKGEYGKNFPKDVYISGRDRPACFGQEHLFDYARTTDEKTIPVIDPFKQDVSAFQCLCLNSIRNRVMIIKNIMVGLRNCLKEIETTGKADAGVCKEVFTLYVCDTLYQVFTWAKEGCIPLPGTSGVRISGAGNADVEEPIPVAGLSAVFGSLGTVWDTVKESGSDLEAEYGETQLSNYLEGGEKALSRKICLNALGMDAGLDFKSLVDMTYTTQFKTSVLGFGRRDFLTYNPATSVGTYEYRGAWTLFTGCKVKDYSVDLVCVNLEEQSRYAGVNCGQVNDLQHGDAPRGCNCLYSDEGYAARSRRFYTSMSSIDAGQFIDQDYHSVVADNKRYDHVRLKITLDKGQDAAKCFPEGHEDGVFFFPVTDKTAEDILDCYVDQRGWFKCTRGLEWEQQGEAWFTPFSADECHANDACYMLCKDSNDKTFKSCNRVKYQIGDVFNLNVKVNGKKKQCIYAYAETPAGEKITGKEFYQIGSTGIDEEYIINVSIPLGTVSPEHFGAISSGNLALVNKSKELNCASLYITRGDKSESRKAGVSTIRFYRTGSGLFNISTLNADVYSNESKAKLITYDLKERLYSPDELKKMLFIAGGPAIQFTRDITIPEIPYSSSGFCQFEAVSSSISQKWNLHAELRYPDRDGQCDGTAIDAISIVGKETILDSTVDVYEKRPVQAAVYPPAPTENVTTTGVKNETAAKETTTPTSKFDLKSMVKLDIKEGNFPPGPGVIHDECTGFMVKKTEEPVPVYTIATAKHCIEGVTTLPKVFEVFFADKTEPSYSTKIDYVDPNLDFGFFSLSYSSNLPVAELGDSNNIKEGDNVYALGYDLTENAFKKSSGKIISYTADHITSSAKVRCGYSGGALLNEEGKIVGLISLGRIPCSSEDDYETTVAIPINKIKEHIPNAVAPATQPETPAVCGNGKLDKGEICEKNSQGWMTNYPQLARTIRFPFSPCSELATSDCNDEVTDDFEAGAYCSSDCKVYSPSVTCTDSDWFGDDGRARFHWARYYYAADGIGGTIGLDGKFNRDDSYNVIIVVDERAYSYGVIVDERITSSSYISSDKDFGTNACLNEKWGITPKFEKWTG